VDEGASGPVNITWSAFLSDLRGFSSAHSAVKGFYRKDRKRLAKIAEKSSSVE
jgi:hypothetical protein